MPADAAGPADSQTNPAEFHSGRPAGISPLTSTGGTTAKLLTDPEHKNTRAKRKGKFGLSPSYETSLLLTQETGIKVDSELMPSLPVQDIQRSVTEREALMPYINDRLSEMSEPAAASRPNATSSDAESGSEIFSDFRAEPKKPSDKIKDNDAIIPSPETIPGPVQDTAGSSDPAAEEEPEIFQPSQPQRPTASVLTEGIMPPATDSLPGDSRPDITQTPASPTSDQVGLSPYLQLTQALFPNPQGLFAVSFPFEPGQPPALTETKAREPDFVSDCEPGGSDDSDTGFVSDRICFQAESEADWFAASSGFPGSQAAENPGDDEHYSHDGVSGLSYQKLTETKSSGEKNNQFDRNDFFTRPSETGESAEQRTSSEHQADVRLDATDRCPAEAGIKRPDLTADYGIQGKIHSRDDSGSDIVAMSRSWYEAQNNKLFKILSIMQWTSIFLVLLIIFQAVTRPEPRYYGVTTELKVVEMIPMKEPSFTPKNIGSWTADVVTRALSLDFLYLREKLTDVQNDFSEIGFESYVKSLEQNGHIKKIETEKLNLSCALTGPPVVTNTKGIGREKTWRVEMPVLVSYQTSQGVVANQSLVAEVTVQKADASKKPRGVEISQLVLLKRG
jgi:intracellular multiplication protein IcmL